MAWWWLPVWCGLLVAAGLLVVAVAAVAGSWALTYGRDGLLVVCVAVTDVAMTVVSVAPVVAGVAAVLWWSWRLGVGVAGRIGQVSQVGVHREGRGRPGSRRCVQPDRELK